MPSPFVTEITISFLPRMPGTRARSAECTQIIDFRRCKLYVLGGSSSELFIEHTWYRSSALEDLLGVPIHKVHTDRLYAGLDRVLPHKAALEKHLIST